MRTAIVFVALLLSACVGAYPTPTDGRLSARINESYAKRDACLARNAARSEGPMGDPRALAHSVAETCAAETEKLIEVSNRDGDPKVASAIRKDSEFRAMGYVLRAHGQAAN